MPKSMLERDQRVAESASESAYGNILGTIGAVIVILAVVWVIFSFITFDTDPATWSTGARALAATIASAMSAGVVLNIWLE